MFKITTDAVKPSDRFEFWDDLVNRQLGPLRHEPAGDQPFHAEMRAQQVGELPVVDVAAAGFRTFHGKSEIARSRFHYYAACVHLDGKASLSDPANDAALSQGDVFIVGSKSEFEIGLERPFRHLIVPLPSEWIESRVPRPDLLSGSVLRHDQPLARLIVGYLAAGFQTAERISASAATMFAQHLLELLGEAFAEPQEVRATPSQARRAALFVRACRLISLKFGDQALRPDHISEELGITTRLLHRLFAERRETVMQRIYAERVSHAARLLALPAARHRTITEIAYACGFSGSSHFSRLFAEHKGMSPSQWRKQAP